MCPYPHSCALLCLCSLSLWPSTIRHVDTRVNAQVQCHLYFPHSISSAPSLSLSPCHKSCFAKAPSPDQGCSAVLITDTIDIPKREWMLSWGLFLPRSVQLSPLPFLVPGPQPFQSSMLLSSAIPSASPCCLLRRKERRQRQGNSQEHRGLLVWSCGGEQEGAGLEPGGKCG